MRDINCSCACALRHPILESPLAEAATDYDAGDGDPFAHAHMHPKAVVLSCGRLVTPLDEPSVRAHVEGEVEACAAIAAAAAAALDERYVRRGDEGDHKWAPFQCPLVEGERAAEEGEVLIPIAALRAACGGALRPELDFRVLSFAEEIARVEEVAGGEENDGDDNEEAGDARAEAAALRAVVDAMTALGGRALTFFRPLEKHDGVGGCVHPFFAVCRTRGAGSIAGVSGLSVWT